MSNVYFEQFESLWNRVKEKFESESSESFTLDNLLNHLISQNLLTNQTSLEPIETKFLQRIGLAKPTDNLKLSDTIFNALNKYVSIGEVSDSPANTDSKTLNELLRESAKSSADKTPPEQIFSEIGFIGREKELSELESFLLSPESRIFALYGVPMIGKTQLVEHFLENNETAKTYNPIPVKLGPNRDTAEQRIKDEVFGDKDFNDFSSFPSNTLIVIRNFHVILNVAGDFKELHNIDDKFLKIKTFLEAATNKNNIKIIIESRYQIRFDTFLDNWKTKVKFLSNHQLEGLERKEFWEFYKTKNFSYKEFEDLCDKFDDHTWLLARAYNIDEVMFYDNKLTKAIDKPILTTNYLWDYIEKIIDQLENREILVICALTFLKKPVKSESLYQDFLSLENFDSDLQIETAFTSLKQKLLIQADANWFYDLNPLIQEVCYTFLEGRRRSQMHTIKNLPYFKEHGETPEYDKIRQAQERGDYMFLFDLGRKLRRGKDYPRAIEALEAGLAIDPKKENVLNEIGICYRENRQLDKAIETLEDAKQRYPDNVWILDELGKAYREDHQLDQAIVNLEKAKTISPKNVQTLNELAICYRENNQLDKAIETLEDAKEKHPDDVKTLNELAICYREDNQLDKAIKTFEEAAKLGNVHSYSELVNTYKKTGNWEKAYETAQEGAKASDWKDSLLIKQLRETERGLSQQKQNKKKALRIFISYSHLDTSIKEKLEAHLAGLRASNKISTWSDGLIMPGEDWDSKIKSELENADIILLLISADFNNSEYIRNNEVNKAIERHTRGEARVIPILCKSCDFDDMPYAKLQALPGNKNFISFPDNNEALTEVAKGIKKVVDELLS